MPRVDVQRIYRALEALSDLADEEVARAEASADPRQRIAVGMASRVLMEVVATGRELIELAESEGRIGQDGYAELGADALQSIEQIEAMQRSQAQRTLVS